VHVDWLRAYEAALGRLPDSYLVIDTETTGLSRQDYILQVGWCEVRSGRVVDCRAETLNWVDYGGTDRHWLASRMDSARQSMSGQGLVYPWTLDLLRDEGEEPIDTLSLLFNRLLEWDGDGLPVVGHNFVSFDARMLGEAGRRFLGYPYRPDDRRVIDTAALEKACQGNLLPNPGEDHGSFFRRVLATRVPNVAYALGDCIRRQGLDRHHSLDMSRQHCADFDCLLCAHLLGHYHSLRDTEITT
jgi:DNA polymerase III epsilon subunit-like protein